jgi:TM2 domain-containing membrane protein YozV
MSIIRIVITNILSAIGSRKVPKVVTIFLFLAIYPSIKSVPMAKTKNKAAYNSYTSLLKNNKTKITGTINIRHIVKILGKL